VAGESRPGGITRRAKRRFSTFCEIISIDAAHILEKLEKLEEKRSKRMDDSHIRILVVDDEAVIREGVARVLTKEGFLVKAVASGQEALQELSRNAYNLVLLDIKMPDMDGLEVLKTLSETETHSRLEIIMITGYPEINTAVQSIKQGAFDYLTKPFTPQQLKLTVRKALEYKQLVLENQLLRKQMELQDGADPLIGKSRAMQKIFQTIDKVAPTDSTVLIYGPSGTGKELVARAIHQHSRRRDKEFVAVDCSALVETLLETELFGHVKGSFTGAIHTKHGFLELANGGTFFFDEISNLSLNIQAKLLRVIQEREFIKVGSDKRIKVDIRIIASTNQDLRRSIREGLFREDLFYRLSVVPIHLPPLRERREDIPLLVDYFLNRFGKKCRKTIPGIAPEALELLMEYDWPGNVRELMHLIERLVVLEDGPTIQAENIPWFIQRHHHDPSSSEAGLVSLNEMERLHIEMTLKKTRGNRSQAAALLGINRKTLLEKIKKHRLETVAKTDT
jgi:DNA-binding NtrC family response regulator